MELSFDTTGFWKPLLALIACVITAQALKVLDDVRAGRTVRLLHNGGMPSAHAAGVAGLAMIVLLEEGFSTVFLIALAFATIVLVDAVGVRRETSRHSKILNKLTGENRYRTVGHEPLEVLAGVLLGVLIPLITYSFF